MEQIVQNQPRSRIQASDLTSRSFHADPHADLHTLTYTITKTPDSPVLRDKSETKPRSSSTGRDPPQKISKADAPSDTKQVFESDRTVPMISNKSRASVHHRDGVRR